MRHRCWTPSVEEWGNPRQGSPRHVSILLSNLEADGLPSVFHRYRQGGAGPTERVENDPSLGAAAQDARLYQGLGEGGTVAVRPRSDEDLHDIVPRLLDFAQVVVVFRPPDGRPLDEVEEMLVRQGEA